MDNYSEMASDEIPELIRGGKTDLAELGGPGAELSTGLILTWRRWLVFGIDARAVPLGARGRTDTAAFVGIGGHVEPGERWTEAVIREASEEANCAVALGDSAVTYLCQEDRVPQPIGYVWHEPQRPLLVWRATFELGRGPERKRIPAQMVTAVFRAAALGQPRPGAEIGALLLLNQELLLQTYAAPCPLTELLECGAQWIGDDARDDLLLAPGGSAFFYAKWLAWQEEV